jgi:hypothetical protein
MNYESQIRNYIKPNLGDVPLLLFVREASERLETSTCSCGAADSFARADRLSSSTRPRVRTTRASPTSHGRETA